MFSLVRPLFVFVVVFLQAPGAVAEDGHVDEASLLQAHIKKKEVAAAAVKTAEARTTAEQKRHLADGELCELPSDSGYICAGASKVEVEAPIASADAGHEDYEDEPVDDEAPEDAASASSGSPASSWLCVEAFLTLTIMGLVRYWTAQNELADDDAAPSEADPAAGKEIWTQFVRAALSGDTTTGNDLILKGFPIGESDIWGSSALHAAAKGGALPLVQRLLERGANVHEMDAWDETPLHLAARAGHKDICDELLAHGALVDAFNAQDWSPLMVAGEAGQEAVCKLLLARGAAVPKVAEDTPPVLRRLLAPEEPETPPAWDYWINEGNQSE